MLNKPKNFRYFAVRYFGGEADSYIENNIKITPDVDKKKLVVLSKHEEHYKAVCSAAQKWRNNESQFRITNRDSLSYFVVEITSENNIQFGDVIENSKI